MTSTDLMPDVAPATGIVWAYRFRLDGTAEPIDEATVRAAPERALRWLSLGLPLLAVGLVAAKL